MRAPISIAADIEEHNRKELNWRSQAKSWRSLFKEAPMPTFHSFLYASVEFSKWQQKYWRISSPAKFPFFPLFSPKFAIWKRFRCKWTFFDFMRFADDLAERVNIFRTQGTLPIRLAITDYCWFLQFITLNWKLNGQSSTCFKPPLFSFQIVPGSLHLFLRIS